VKAKKEYCLICKAVWVNNDAEWERKYIQCDSPKCQMWIHNECDPLLSSDPEIFREYNSDES
jgi:hypothetical protein